MLKSEAGRQSIAKVSMDHIVHNRDARFMDHIVHNKGAPIVIFPYSQSHICSYLTLLPGILSAISFIENRPLDHECHIEELSCGVYSPQCEKLSTVISVAGILKSSTSLSLERNWIACEDICLQYFSH